MKRFISLLVVVALVLAFAGVANAVEPDKGKPEGKPAWGDKAPGHWGQKFQRDPEFKGPMWGRHFGPPPGKGFGPPDRKRGPEMPGPGPRMHRGPKGPHNEFLPHHRGEGKRKGKGPQRDKYQKMCPFCGTVMA